MVVCRFYLGRCGTFDMEITNNTVPIDELLKAFKTEKGFHTVSDWEKFLKEKGCTVRQIVAELHFDF